VLTRTLPAINVSSQNIGVDKGQPTTVRNQSLKDLLGQAKHYQASTRKGTVRAI